jgi:3-methyladenine DNA glycosylase AlkD
LELIIKTLWALPKREYQIVAIDLLVMIHKQLTPEHIKLIEEMIMTKSWWDTVDGIASTLVGGLFQKHPELIHVYTKKWLASEDMWLQRTALLFQLRYKHNTDETLLFQLITDLSDSDEFFIQKAIGWALREYAKSKPDTVRAFAARQALKPLSKREALKHLGWIK